MTPDSRAKLVKTLVRDESMRLKPYMDCCGKQWFNCFCEKKGKLSVGIGRNLDDVGITQDEAKFLLDNDITRCERELFAVLPWAQSLDEVRQRALMNLAFNMGTPTLLTFKKTLAHIQAGRWEEAAVELLQSRYAEQVGDRALRVAESLRSGKDV